MVVWFSVLLVVTSVIPDAMSRSSLPDADKVSDWNFGNHFIEKRQDQDEILNPFVGIWKEDTVENFDKLADAAGISMSDREYMRKGKALVTYKRNGDVWVARIGEIGNPLTHEYSFRIGHEFLISMIDGTPLKCRTDIEGQHLLTKCRSEALPHYNIRSLKWVSGNKMILKVTIGNTTQTVTYIRQTQQ